jgi:hypothetical protein
MAPLITKKFKIHAASSIQDEVDSVDHNYYMFIARSLAWADENIPDEAVDTRVSEIDLWDNLIAMKKMQLTDTSFVIPRHNWDSSGLTKYVAWSKDDEDLFDHPTVAEISAASTAGDYTAGSFYVLTSDFKLYICLGNDNDVKSTVQPTGTSTNIIETADGYKWKYLFSISESDQSKFLTEDWIPVKTLTSDDSTPQFDVQEYAVDGSIDIIRVTNAGSGYENAYDGDVAAATITTITLDSSASSTNDIYNGATIWITGSVGGGQSRVISDYVGSTKVATLSTPWLRIPTTTDSFEILPTITIVGNGSGATAKPTIVEDAISNINIVSVGSDYTHATVTVESNLGGTGATAVAEIGPFGGHGSDPVKELGASRLMFNCRFSYAETDFVQDNDYRIFGIVQDVLSTSTGEIADESSLSGMTKLTLTSLTGTFSPDETVTTNDTSGKLVSVSGSDLFVIQTSATDQDDFVTGVYVTGSTSLASGYISVVTPPEVVKLSGNFMVVEQRKAITRSSDQTEDIKIVLSF